MPTIGFLNTLDIYALRSTIGDTVYRRHRRPHKVLAVLCDSRRLAGGGTRDVEPLVDAGIDRGRGLVLARGDVERSGVGLVGRVRDGGIGESDVVLGGLASNELLPSLGALTDNVHGVLLVLALAREGELVLGLAVGDLVDAEPLVGGTQKAGQVAFDVLNIVQLGGQGVVDVDHDDLPVSLALVEQSHDTEDLDLDDISRLVDKLTDLADIERVVVTVGLGLGVCDVGVLPCLQQQPSVLSVFCRADIGRAASYLREGTVVPEVALVGEAVADEAELALLGVLLDGVEGLLLGDLLGMSVTCRNRGVAEHQGGAQWHSMAGHAPPS
jgi:hypothetical protein